MKPVQRAASDNRVSVIITSYNHERYIARALDGVLEQRGVEPYEVLIGDDCSTDGSRSIIESYARRYPHVIQPVFPRENMGLAGKAIFAELVKRSRGRYIAGLDGDDYWTSADKLHLQTEYLDEHPECAMCFHNVNCLSEDGEAPARLYNSPEQPQRLELDQLFGFNPVASCSPVFRRGTVDPLPPWYFHLPWGDWPLYFLAAQCGQIHYLPDVMGVYRIHGNGMYSSMSRLGRLELDVKFFEGLAGVPAAEDGRRRWRLAVALAWLAHEHLKLGEREAARHRLAESFRVWPVDPRKLRRGQGERRRLALWLSMKSPSRRPLGRSHETWAR